MKSKLKINPEILYDENGNAKGVLLKVRDFEKLIERLEDLHDLHMAYERTSKKFKTIPYKKIRKEIFGSDAKE
jgi:DNA-dependent RNA polymerase auxiliary subunit epsilon